MDTQQWCYYAVLITAISIATAYPTGATIGMCLTMFPKHKGTQSQLERDVYVVTADKTTYRPNERIKVTVKSAVGKLIKGFQIRAHRTDFNPEEILGTYENLTPANKLKYITCQGNTTNMVTHANNETVKEITVTWIAPAVNVGPVIFEVTIVQSYFVFYHGLTSAIISPDPSSPQVTLPSFIVPKILGTVAPMDWGECDETKGCLLYPRYCTGDNCKVAVSYLVNKVNDTATFELMVQAEKYISLGFSQDMIMGNDQTVSCVSIYDRVNIVAGWNHPRKSNIPDLKTNLTNLEAASKDGRIYCRFTRPMKMDLMVTYDVYALITPVTLTFDLNDDLYLFVAWGETYAGTDIIGYHYNLPVMSETKVDFSEHKIYRGSVMSRLMRAHSTMMAVAWMGFAGLAIVMPRYYKNGFNERLICGIKIWFHVHRISALITFALTIAGVVLVLIKMEGLVTQKQSAFDHMCLGFTVVALVCAQVLIGFIRPGPDKKIRPIFNFVHRLLGIAALVIAAAALICAYKIEDFSYDAQRFGQRTVAVWAGIFVFLEIVLTGYNYFSSFYCVHTSHSDEYNLEKQTNIVRSENTTPSNILLAIFILFIACSITAAFCMTLFF